MAVPDSSERRQFGRYLILLPILHKSGDPAAGNVIPQELLVSEGEKRLATVQARCSRGCREPDC